MSQFPVFTSLAALLFVAPHCDAIAVAHTLAETCDGLQQGGPCIFSEEFDCDSKDFFRGEWTFSDGGIGFGECYAPPGVLPPKTSGSCIDDSNCDWGYFCDQGECSAVYNYFCANRVKMPTTHGCNKGRFPICGGKDAHSTCRDEWFECPTHDKRRWPSLGDTCEDIVLMYEIVAEQVDTGSSSRYCSKRHEGCAQQQNCTASNRASADHCGPVSAAYDSMNYDCFEGGDNQTPKCPGSSSPDWPTGLGSQMDAQFIARAEEKVGAVCAAAGCGDRAVCRPADGSDGYTTGGLGIQGSSGIKDDSFIGHARVCKDQAEGRELCNDPRRSTTSDPHGPCIGGPENDDSRDVLVSGPVSRREIDIRCRCVAAADDAADDGVHSHFVSAGGIICMLTALFSITSI